MLAVGAHPDDLEILCGGTLARYAAAGHTVVMCHATVGDKGTRTETSEEIARIRRAEAQQAAAVVGAESATLGLRDGTVSSADPAQRLAMVETIRAARPDVIITHHLGDYMSDHDETARLVWSASFDATLPRLETASPPIEVVAPPLFGMETLAGIGFAPTEYVDITGHLETKLEMLRTHATQLRWLGGHGEVDILDQVEVTARFRGHQCGVRHAEGFAARLAWLRPRTERLLP